MTDLGKFRSAVGGFNRTDVANYIEASALEHQKELRKWKDDAEHLRAEKESLTTELRGIRGDLEAACIERDALKTECDSLHAECDALHAECDTLCAAAGAAPQASAPAQVEPEQEKPSEQELEAYRRAEAVERAARVRAKKLSDRLSAMLAELSAAYAGTGQELSQMADAVSGEVERMQAVFGEMQVTFSESTAKFEALQDEAEAE